MTSPAKTTRARSFHRVSPRNHASAHKPAHTKLSPECASAKATSCAGPRPGDRVSGVVSEVSRDCILSRRPGCPAMAVCVADLVDFAYPRRLHRRTKAPDDETDAFRLSVAALQKRYGTKVSAWTWRKAATVTLAHPLGGIPGFRWLNRGRVTPQGTAVSVWVHKFNRNNPVRFAVLYGPGLRLVVDFSDLPGSLISIPGGESGRPDNRHYADLLPLFEKGARRGPADGSDGRCRGRRRTPGSDASLSLPVRARKRVLTAGARCVRGTVSTRVQGRRTRDNPRPPTRHLRSSPNTWVGKPSPAAHCAWQRGYAGWTPA